MKKWSFSVPFRIYNSKIKNKDFAKHHFTTCDLQQHVVNQLFFFTCGKILQCFRESRACCRN